MIKKKHIVLIGFSGSGKSTVGPKLAARLGVRFLDVDSLIEKHAGCSVTEIFRQQGEKAFRQRERRLIESLMKRRSRALIALGGGAFENGEVRKQVRFHGLVIYLSCSVREIYRRMKDKIDRPLLKARSHRGQTEREARLGQIKQLMKKRLINYRTADAVISTTQRSPRQVAARAYRMIRSYHGNR